MRLLALCVALAQTAAWSGERFAWALGENTGLPAEEPLRFAQADAERVLGTLVALGQVPTENAFLVRGADSDAARQALARLEATLQARPQKPERLTLYVSSHGSEGALHLRGSVLPTADLVAFAKRANAEVVVLIIDACRSGSVTSTKGLKRVEATPTQLDAVALEGRVFISASGDDEYAQESEALQGSYFTHHLVAGLRGAADVSGDGRVTLEEAYRWAWTHTIEGTFGSRAGVQRPSFRVDLRGEGSLVLTELAAGGSRLVLEAVPGGRWLVVDEGAQGLLAELDGATERTLALAPGRYRMRLAHDGLQYEHRLVLLQGETKRLGNDVMLRSPATRTAVKGRDVPIVVISAGVTVGTPLVEKLEAELGGELRVRLDLTGLRLINQLSAAVMLRTGQSTISVPFRFTEAEAKAGLAHRFDVGRVSIALGVMVGALLVSQTELPGLHPRLSLGPTLEAQLEGRVRLAGPLELYALVSGGGGLLRKPLPMPVGRVQGALGVALGF